MSGPRSRCLFTQKGLITSRVSAPWTSLPSINNLNSVITYSSDSSAVSDRSSVPAGWADPARITSGLLSRWDLLVRLVRHQRPEDAGPAADECHERDSAIVLPMGLEYALGN